VSGFIFASSFLTTGKDLDGKQALMKKYLTLAALIIAFAGNAQAQNASSTAQQTVQLDLSNAVEMTFVNSGNATGNTVTMNFNTADNYANGVESAAQELKIRSNKDFKVAVKIDYSSFSYAGTGTINLATIPTNAFEMKLVDNNTGGSVAAPFSTTSYSTITATDQDVILNGNNGDDQRFSVKYKCTPGFGLPAGTYSFNMVYTATQP
jgi:hypothetical protein